MSTPIRLGEKCLKIGSGSTPRGGDQSYKESGISLIRSQNILDLSFSYDGLAFIDEEQAYDLRNVEVSKNDILVNITGDSVARVCMVPEKVLPARVNQHVAIIRPNPTQIDNKWLMYYLIGIKEELLSLSEIGATRRALTKGMLESLEINLPTLPDQKAIAEVLGSLGNKIELLHQQNKTLVKMAETLFRQLFIEEAKEDWECRPLAELCEITRGASPRPIIKYVENGTIPWIKISDATASNSFFIDSTKEFVTSEGASKSVKVFPGDLILSNSATCGVPCVVNLEGCIHDGWLLFRNFNAVSKNFVLFYLMQMNRELNNIADGSVQNNLNTSMLKELQVKIPDKLALASFDQQADLIVSKMHHNVLELESLNNARDHLIPKLMSGELIVS